MRFFGRYSFGFLLTVVVFVQTAVCVIQPQLQEYVGIRQLKRMAPELTGSGSGFAVICRSFTYLDGIPQNDYRPAVWHNCFEDGRFIFHDYNGLTAGISPHSTAVCSILFGSDPNGFNSLVGRFRYEGIVPAAKADVYEFWHFLANNVFDNIPVDSDILVASMGSYSQDWWSRGIESLVDEYGLIAVMAIGNGYTAGSGLLYPAAGANVIGVGVVDSVDTGQLPMRLSCFSLPRPAHSSFGPTQDGRCKPDIVAPGDCLVADINDPAGYTPAGNWSSFSTPLTAGVLGLLVQTASGEPNLSAALDIDGGNCVMKAVLMNSATKLPFWHKGRLTRQDDHEVPLDYIQGAGLLNAPRAYNQLSAGRNRPGDVPEIGWDLGVLSQQDGEETYRFTVSDPNRKVIAITAVWNRHYRNRYPFEPDTEKDSDLRLELWAVDTNKPDNDYLLDYSDSSVDNVEHIYMPLDANYIDYEIAISYSDMDKSKMVSQLYGLAWSVDDYNCADSNDILWYDLNSDGIVNNRDFSVVIENMHDVDPLAEEPVLGDIDGNGAIDVNDIRLLLNNRNRRAEWYQPQP